MTPREAFFTTTESVALPGIPLLAPGERVTDAVVGYLRTGAAEGMYAEGCVDQSLSSLRIVG
ncbi:MAG TPA: hypothetical protein VFN65_03500 [Solirubrobacteraceae bacterium]|nr:hypothetical protein [Solirubrobacteraceae bacterium]